MPPKRKPAQEKKKTMPSWQKTAIGTAGLISAGVLLKYLYDEGVIEIPPNPYRDMMPGFSFSIPKQSEKEVLLGQLSAARAAADFRDETADVRAMDELAASINLDSITPLNIDKATVDRWSRRYNGEGEAEAAADYTSAVNMDMVLGQQMDVDDPDDI